MIYQSNYLHKVLLLNAFRKNYLFNFDCIILSLKLPDTG
jgi:hypothetical protein